MIKDLFNRTVRRAAAGSAVALAVAGAAASPALAANQVALATAATASSSSASSTTSSSSTSSSSTTTTSSSSTTTATSAANCATPALSEPFASLGDTNEYAAAPGLAFDSFTGTGWTLSGGATISSTKLQDATTGPVLNLPSGAQAVSPAMCVQYDYPDARMLVRNPSGTDGVTLLAEYQGTNNQTSTSYALSGRGTGWTLSPVFETHPGNESGWQLVVFTIKGSVSGTTQVYNFFVDPRMR
jgi:hypothetical protein